MIELDETGAHKTSTEHRGEGRRRVLLSGKIVYGEAELCFDCAIRDLSEAGARIRLSAPMPLPGELFLIDLKTGLAYEARLAWRRSPEYGLQFLHVHDLRDPAALHLKTLKRIWVEHCAR